MPGKAKAKKKQDMNGNIFLLLVYKFGWLVFFEGKMVGKAKGRIIWIIIKFYREKPIKV